MLHLLSKYIDTNNANFKTFSYVLLSTVYFYCLFTLSLIYKYAFIYVW